MNYNPHEMHLQKRNVCRYTLNDLLSILLRNFFAVWIQKYFLFSFLPTGLFFLILWQEQRYRAEPT